jgi:uncharacterized protein YbaP (TraB family)
VLWHVEGTNLHLMGSIHVLEKTRHGLFPEAEHIYQQAQRVAFETDMATPPDPVLFENVAGEPLSTQVPPAVFASAVKEWVNLGLDPARLEQFLPWMAAMAIGLIGAEKRGIDTAHGVDKALWGRTEQEGKVRITLESHADLFTIIRAMPAHETASFLDYATNPSITFQNDIDFMIKAWHDHDDGAMERILDHRLSMWPVGFEKLITALNQAWMPRIAQLAADRSSTLAVVGALHCVGENGIPRLLEGRGSRLSRIV